MCHGFAAVKEHGLEPFARAFAQAGFVVLVHDHRNFGASDGEPRQDVAPMLIADWRVALGYLAARPEADPDQLGIWGSSYSGGHALIVVASDRRVKCVVSQVPTISGSEQGRRRVSPEALPAFLEMLADDARTQQGGAPPRVQAVVSADTGTLAAYRTEARTWRRQLDKHRHAALDPGGSFLRARGMDRRDRADAVDDGHCQRRRHHDDRPGGRRLCARRTAEAARDGSRRPFHALQRESSRSQPCRYKLVPAAPQAAERSTDPRRVDPYSLTKGEFRCPYSTRISQRPLLARAEACNRQRTEPLAGGRAGYPGRRSLHRAKRAR
nr:alpha/beta fold hydrolase [Cupriavidus sp. KK10]